MKHDLKSDIDKLENRGLALYDDIKSLENKSMEELIVLLKNKNPITRTSAAINLKPYVNKSCSQLLEQLSKEKALYTKIAISETLQNGNTSTAKKMIKYLGTIGSNQYKELPKKVSLKKSYPIPRDIISRILCKMNVNIFNILLDVLKSGDLIKIYEVIDVIGFMVFYNQTLSTENNLSLIIDLMSKYRDDKILTWKCIICLSSFNFDKSKSVLNKFINDNDDIFSLEAKRSLSLLSNRK